MSEPRVDPNEHAGGAGGSPPAPVATADVPGPAPEPSAPEMDAAGEAGLDDAGDRLAEAEAQRDEYLADLQRLAADFDNYRKRAVREQQAFAARAHERLVAKLLPVLDDLERALDAAEHHEEAKLAEGVALTRSSLVATLASEGLVEIDAAGAFDPHVHEALMTQPAGEAEPGQILQVVQKGYRLGDAVLRPARVIVAATDEEEA